MPASLCDYLELWEAWRLRLVWASVGLCHRVAGWLLEVGEGRLGWVEERVGGADLEPLSA